MRSSWGAEMSWPGLRLCWRAWRLPVGADRRMVAASAFRRRPGRSRPSREWCWCTGWVAAARAGCCGSSRAWQRDRSRAHLAYAARWVPFGWIWEDKQRDDPASYAGAAGPSLVTVLDAVQQAVLAAVRTPGQNRRSVITDRALPGCQSMRHVSRTWWHRAGRLGLRSPLRTLRSWARRRHRRGCSRSGIQADF